MTSNTNYNLNRFNSFLETATKALMCGPSCQEEKKKQELKSKLLKAKNNLILAEPEYELAKQNYYTFTKGESEYNEMLENELNNKVQEKIDNLKIKINENVEKIERQYETYNGLLINVKNVEDLYLNYKKENKELISNLKDEINEFLINDRKTYYEDQRIDYLKGYYSYILIILYYIIVICLIIISLKFPSNYSLKIRIILIIIVLILPFFSTYILGKIIQLIYYLISLFPKNVYNNL
jgi:hypothetical protein